MKARKNLVFIMTMALPSLLLAGLILAGPHIKRQKDLVIYDVHTNSPRIVKDDGTIDFADYFYIRNQTDHAYDLIGLFLSDDGHDLQKYPLDGLVIESGQSQMIRLDPSWNFGLKRTGEESIYLSDSEGQILYKYNANMKPKQPVISAESGFYDHDFDVTISVKGDYTIYYTLDGSEPDENANPYTGPIHVYDRSNEPNCVVNVPNTVAGYWEEELDDRPVDKAFILRAAAYDENGNHSGIVTREYFFCKDKYPRVLSIVADRDDLFGPYGILSTGKAYDDWVVSGMDGEAPEPNFDKKGREWEVPADVELFQDWQSVFVQKCGLRLQGRTSRDYRLKNFQLRARNRYSGTDVIGYDFFNDSHRSDAVILDDSFQEAFLYSIVDEKTYALSPKVTKRIALFLNGEFWKDIYIRQKLDERFFADHYGVDETNLIVLSESFADIGNWEEDHKLYVALDEFVENHELSEPQNYAELQELMDTNSYIDYLAINAWIGNNDWGEFENDMQWRARIPDASEYGDGKLRWMLHDMDHIFDQDEIYADNRFLMDSVLYQGLMNNEDFRERYEQRIRELGETVFSESNIDTELSKWDESAKESVSDFFNGRKEYMSNIQLQ